MVVEKVNTNMRMIVAMAERPKSPGLDLWKLAKAGLVIEAMQKRKVMVS